jgi:hypothetical protein
MKAFLFVSDQTRNWYKKFPKNTSTRLQGNELCRAGFKFAIVNDLFTVHSGIKLKERNDYINFLTEEADSGRMQQIADAFMDRLDKMYPNTLDDCPKQFKSFHWSRNYLANDFYLKS